MRVLTAGPHGGYNLGDEVILGRVLGDLRSAGHHVSALSGDPEQTAAYHGIEALAGLDLRKLRFGALRRLAAADALVIAGGEQIQEGRYGNPLWGLLPTVAHLVRAAHRLGTPSMLWGIGVSPIATPHARWLIRHWIARATAATVRDSDSYSRLASLGFPIDRLYLAADPAFGLQRVPHEEAAASQPFEQGGVGQTPTLLFVPSNDTTASTRYLGPLVHESKAAAARLGGKVVVLFMDRQTKYDLALLRKPEFREDHLLRCLPAHTYSPQQLQRIFAAADVVVTTRMHGAILAATQGTPVINVARAPKMLVLGTELGIPTFPLGSLGLDSVAEACVRAVAEGRTAWQATHDPQVAILATRARVSVEIFARLSRRFGE